MVGCRFRWLLTDGATTITSGGGSSVSQRLLAGFVFSAPESVNVPSGDFAGSRIETQNHRSRAALPCFRPPRSLATGLRGPGKPVLAGSVEKNWKLVAMVAIK